MCARCSMLSRYDTRTDTIVGRCVHETWYHIARPTTRRKAIAAPRKRTCGKSMLLMNNFPFSRLTMVESQRGM